jgi:hypothetical protein
MLRAIDASCLRDRSTDTRLRCEVQGLGRSNRMADKGEELCGIKGHDIAFRRGK